MGHDHAFGDFPYGNQPGTYIPGMKKANGVTDYDSDDDLDHGTAVASVAAGRTCGLAPGCALHAVKVIDSQDRSSESWIIAGLDYVQRHAPSSQPAVVNMSLELGIDPTVHNGGRLMRQAIDFLIARKIPVVVAAGNDGIDAAHVVPAGFSEAITVGGSQISDRTPGLTSAVESIADYTYYGHGAVGSNYGPLVDVFAPSVGVHDKTFNLAEYPRVSHDYYSALGTSFAAPLVTGAVAQYLQKYPSATPAQVQSWIAGSASVGKLNLGGGFPANTANRLLYTNL